MPIVPLIGKKIFLRGYAGEIDHDVQQPALLDDGPDDHASAFECSIDFILAYFVFQRFFVVSLDECKKHTASTPGARNFSVAALTNVAILRGQPSQFGGNLIFCEGRALTKFAAG